MGDILVTGGTTADGRITALNVELHGLPARTLTRDTALAWMRDGHSFIPRIGGVRGTALQLVEVGDELVIRHDNAPVAQDSLPDGLR